MQHGEGSSRRNLEHIPAAGAVRISGAVEVAIGPQGHAVLAFVARRKVVNHAHRPRGVGFPDRAIVRDTASV